MRVLFFNYEYPPLGGGAANATSYILQEFSKIHGLNVDLVTSSIDNEYHLETIRDGIKIHRLPIGKNKDNLHFQSQKDLLVYAWKAYWFSRKLIHEATDKYGLSHSFFTVPCGFLSMLLRWQNDIPYIVSLRGADVPGYSERFTFLYKVITPLIKSIWKNASKVISNSQGLKELALKADSKRNIQIIHNGVDIDHFRPADGSSAPMMGAVSSNFYITAGASRITARKGINYLIEAIGKLSGKYQNIYMDIIGDGNEKDNLENLVEKLKLSDRIKFIGRVPREKTAPYYQKASLFVLPSLNEGMSNAMLEALACGLPIISTDTGGAKELVKEGENGFIVKMKDSNDLAEKIEKIMGNNELRKRMGLKSREMAENLSWKKVAEDYYRAYESTNQQNKKH